MDKKTLGNLIDICYRALRREGDGAPRRPVAKPGLRLRYQGRHLHRHQGHGHPCQKQEFLERAQKEVAEIENQYLEG